MGEVWRAYDTDTDRIVAVKVLPAHFSDNQEFQRRFRREAHAAARLNTPHAVPIHYYGEIDGRLYVDMRLIEGRDLQAVLAEGPMEPARAVRIVEGVAKALQAAHQIGLLHRDVKPSNILLDHDDFAYLIDFGIARALDETRLTKSDNTIGTFQYIAPERFRNQAQEDARADIYSLACVLYECLTRRAPFDSKDLPGLMAAHLTAPIPRPSRNRPRIPPGFDDVIARGMAKKPQDRYDSAGELAAAAREALVTRGQGKADTVLARTQAARSPEKAKAPAAAKPPAGSRTKKRPPAKAPPISQSSSRAAAKSPTKSQGPSAKPPVGAKTSGRPPAAELPKYHKGEFTWEFFAVSVCILAVIAGLIWLIAFLAGAI
jgi:serine/threonine protein kinase